jgi:hypothetical protein
VRAWADGKGGVVRPDDGHDDGQTQAEAVLPGGPGGRLALERQPRRRGTRLQRQAATRQHSGHSSSAWHSSTPTSLTALPAQDWTFNMHGIDTQSSRFQAAVQACQDIMSEAHKL